MSIKKILNLFSFKTLCLISLLALIIFHFLRYSPSFLILELPESQPHLQNFQLFFNTGNGFNETESKINSINYKNYQLIPLFRPKNISSLRFDPTDKSNQEISIKTIHYLTLRNNFLINKNQIDSTRQLELFNDQNLIHLKSKDIDSSLQINLTTNSNKTPLILKITISVFIFLISLIIIKIPIFLKRNKLIVKIINSNLIYKISSIVLILWFLFQVLFFSFKIKPGIPPDENYHYNLSLLYQNANVFPLANTVDTYVFGSINTQPYLYHLLLGKSLYLNFFNLNSFTFLRIINILISCLNIFIIFKIISISTKDKLVQIATLIISTNLLMFNLLSGSISYDNLVNLFANLSILFLLKYLDRPNLQSLLYLYLILLAGTLTKTTIIPIFFIETVIIFLINKKSIKKIKVSKNVILKPINITLFIFLTFFIILNSKLYLSNLIKYHSLSPSTEKVIGIDNALKYYPEYSRNLKVLETKNDEKKLNFNSFFLNYIDRTEGTILGILGHKSMLKYGNMLTEYKILLIPSLILLILSFNKIKKNKKIISLIIISIFYLLVVFISNYQTYLTYNWFGFALQGRYNFPVITGINILISLGLLNKFSHKIKIILIIILLLIFTSNGFIWFLSNASPEWYI